MTWCFFNYWLWKEKYSFSFRIITSKGALVQITDIFIILSELLFLSWTRNFFLTKTNRWLYVWRTILTTLSDVLEFTLLFLASKNDMASYWCDKLYKTPNCWSLINNSRLNFWFKQINRFRLRWCDNLWNRKGKFWKRKGINQCIQLRKTCERISRSFNRCVNWFLPVWRENGDVLTTLVVFRV